MNKVIGYNVIIISDIWGNLLFCKRRKEPFKGLLNFVGGKIEEGETSFEAAYRELREETGIDAFHVELIHLVDTQGYDKKCLLEVYAGRLIHPVNLIEEKNPLVWVPQGADLLDDSTFAGKGDVSNFVTIARELEIIP